MQQHRLRSQTLLRDKERAMNNLTSLPTIVSGLVLATLVACASTNAPAPATGAVGNSVNSAATSDAALTNSVLAGLAQQQGINPADIAVESYDGEVRLSGFAASQQEIDTAVAAARSVAGVKVVRNDMKLKDAAK
jgi:hypothetical protein